MAIGPLIMSSIFHVPQYIETPLPLFLIPFFQELTPISQTLSSLPFFISQPSTHFPSFFPNSSSLLHPCVTLKHEKAVGVKGNTIHFLKISI